MTAHRSICAAFCCASFQSTNAVRITRGVKIIEPSVSLMNLPNKRDLVGSFVGSTDLRARGRCRRAALPSCIAAFQLGEKVSAILYRVHNVSL
jgi:hypothetical protein